MDLFEVFLALLAVGLILMWVAARNRKARMDQLELENRNLRFELQEKNDSGNSS